MPIRDQELTGDRYVHLRPEEQPRPLGLRGPFKAVVIVEGDVSPSWRHEVGLWLVREGCRFMMAWGTECSKWDDAVDEANLALNDWKVVEGDRFVMTTWHDGEGLPELFEFCAKSAHHPSLALGTTIIIHIADRERRTELLAKLCRAEAE